MDLVTFNQQITILSQQIANLGAASLDEVGLPFEEALARLADALEELHAAEDELRQQNRQLIDSQDTLEAERQRWHSLFDLAPDGYLVTDLKGVIISANHAAADLLGAAVAELVGAPLAVFVPSGQGWDFLGRLLELAHQGGRAEWKLDLLPHRGHPFPALVRVVELPAEHRADGAPPQPAELAWLIHDISEQGRIEHELSAAHDDLDLRVQERTAQLSAGNAVLQHHAEVLADQRDQVQRSEAQFRALARRLVESQERERSYVADRLYNEAAQVLAALGLQLDALQRAAGTGPSTGAQLAETRETLASAMREMHRVAVSLHPAVLDRLGLAAALRQDLAEFGEGHGLHTQFVAAGLDGVRMPVAVETAVYRIVQDGLHNVAQHARATYVGLTLSRSDGYLAVTLEDDGVGFDQALAARQGALGLVAMRERAVAVDGDLAVESQPGGGTVMIVRVPIQDPAWPGSLPAGGRR